MINKLKRRKKMKKVRVEEVKSGNAVMQTFGGLLIAVGILDFALSWGGTNITAFFRTSISIYSNGFRFYWLCNA